MIWNTELKREYKEAIFAYLRHYPRIFLEGWRKTKHSKWGCSNLHLPNTSHRLSFTTANILVAHSCPSHQCCLYKTCLVFYVLWVTAENFGLHAGNTKFITKNEEWINIHIIIHNNFTCTFVCTSWAIKLTDDDDDDDDDDRKNLFMKCNSRARLGVAIFSPYLENELVM